MHACHQDVYPHSHPNPTPIYVHESSHVPDTNHTDSIINQDNALVILSKQTTLSETQKNLLRKGLTFVPKPKTLSIQTLHTDIRNFMHRMKTIYELKTKTKLGNEPRKQNDPFTPKQSRKPNPDRLTDNGTLDTFLHRIRLEMLDENKHKQT